MRWRGGAPHPHVRSQEWLCFYARVRGGTLCWVLELCGNPSCVSTAVTEVTCSSLLLALGIKTVAEMWVSERFL